MVLTIARDRAAGTEEARREERPRLIGGAYQSILRRVDEFLDLPVASALKERERRGRKILKLDDAASAAMEKLKARGLTSPYRKTSPRPRRSAGRRIALRQIWRDDQKRMR
jgi:hypothetical protein